MKINKEIALIDLLKLVILTIGGILGFFLIQNIATRNDTLRTQKLFMDELPGLYPNLKTHYTNQFDSTGKMLKVKVYLESKSHYPIVVKNPPIIWLKNNQHQVDSNFHIINRNQFTGVISPGTKLEITYNIKADSAVHKFISLDLYAEIDPQIKKMYGCMFREVVKSVDKVTFNYITTKNYGYAEKTYSYKTNPIWKDFFDNPR